MDKKFSHQDSKISISAKETKGTLIIKAKDIVIGIEVQNLNKIFDRFTRAKNIGAKGEKPIGLGISIVKQIIEKQWNNFR